MTEIAASDSKLRTGRRSPSFPFIPLGRAIERARSLATDYKRTPTRLSNAAQTWGYKPKSSGCLQTVAALKAFGLIEDVGTGDDRKVQLTDLAWRVMHDQRPGVRENALQDAALRPKLIAEFAHGPWRGGRPADHHCISELTIDRGFTEDAARTFLKVFDETISYSGLHESDKLSAPRADAAPTEAAYVAADREEVGPLDPPVGRGGAMHPPISMEERQFLHGPLGAGIEYRLLVTGEIGPREIGKLIRILQLQKELLSDEGSDS